VDGVSDLGCGKIKSSGSSATGMGSELCSLGIGVTFGLSMKTLGSRGGKSMSCASATQMIPMATNNDVVSWRTTLA
jgi:hypothetical protein